MATPSATTASPHHVPPPNNNPFIPALSAIAEAVGLQYAPCGLNNERFQGTIKSTLQAAALGFSSVGGFDEFTNSMRCLATLGAARENRTAYTTRPSHSNGLPQYTLDAESAQALECLLRVTLDAPSSTPSPYWVTRQGASKAGFSHADPSKLKDLEEHLLSTVRKWDAPGVMAPPACWSNNWVVLGPKEGLGERVVLFNVSWLSKQPSQIDESASTTTPDPPKLANAAALLRKASYVAFGEEAAASFFLKQAKGKGAPAAQNNVPQTISNPSTYPQPLAMPSVQHYTTSGAPVPPHVYQELEAHFKQMSCEQLKRLEAFSTSNADSKAGGSTRFWGGVDYSLLDEEVSLDAVALPQPEDPTQQPKKSARFVPASMSCFWGTKVDFLAKGLSLRRGARPILQVPAGGSWFRPQETATMPAQEGPGATEADEADNEDDRYAQLLQHFSIPNTTSSAPTNRGGFTKYGKAPLAAIHSWCPGATRERFSKHDEDTDSETRTEGLFNLVQCADREHAVAAVRGARFWPPLSHLPSPSLTTGRTPPECTSDAASVDRLKASVKEAGNETSIYADPFRYSKFVDGHGGILSRTSESIGDSDAMRANKVLQALHALLGLLLHPNTFPDLVCTAGHASNWWRQRLQGNHTTSTNRLPPTASTINSPPAWITNMVAAARYDGNQTSTQPINLLSLPNVSPLAEALLSLYADLTLVPLSPPPSTANNGNAKEPLQPAHQGTFPTHNFWLTEAEMKSLGLRITDKPPVIGALTVLVALNAYLRKFYLGSNGSGNQKAKQAASDCSDPPTAPRQLWDYTGLDSAVASEILNSNLLAFESSLRFGNSPVVHTAKLISGKNTTSAPSSRRGPKPQAATFVTLTPARAGMKSDITPMSLGDSVSEWILSEVGKADAIQVIEGLSYNSTSVAPPPTTAASKYKFPFLPDTLELVLMNLFRTFIQQNPESAVVPDGFLDSISFKRCADGERVYCGLFCEPMTVVQSEDSRSRAFELSTHAILNLCCAPGEPTSRFPGDPSSCVVSLGCQYHVTHPSGRPQPPPSPNAEWIPIRIELSDTHRQLLGSELSPEVCGALTQFRLVNGLFRFSPRWHAVSFFETSDENTLWGWIRKSDVPALAGSHSPSTISARCFDSESEPPRQLSRIRSDGGSTVSVALPPAMPTCRITIELPLELEGTFAPNIPITIHVCNVEQIL